MPYTPSGASRQNKNIITNSFQEAAPRYTAGIGRQNPPVLKASTGPPPPGGYMQSNGSSSSPLAPPRLPSMKSIPSGFSLTGSLSLFGNKNLVADVYDYTGPIPDNLRLPPSVAPNYQLAVFSHQLGISSLLPEFANTEFDQVKLDNFMVTYQNYRLSDKDTLGWHVDANIVFDDSYGKLHDLLTQFFGIKNPTLSIQCGLGPIQSWAKPLWVPSFTLKGVFDNVHISPCGGVVMNQIGVGLVGYNSITRLATGEVKSTKSYGFTVFGSLLLDVPGRANPLDLIFQTSEVQGQFRLTADLLTDWDDAFGIQNLTLQDVSFATSFAIKAPFSGLSFDINANFESGLTAINLGGRFSINGDFEISAMVENFDWMALNDIYEHLFGDTLSIPDIPISVGRATLLISKTAGLTISLEDIVVDGHTGASGTLTLSSSGVHVRAEINGGVFNIGDFKLSKAFLDLSYGRYNDGVSTSVLFGGEFEWLGFTLDVGAHVYRSSESTGIEYTIFGRFATNAQGQGFTLATLAPSIKGTFLDNLSLDGLCLIIASKDNPEFGAMPFVEYPIHKGIQMCAVIKEIQPITTLTANNPPILILQVSWRMGANSAFDIGIMFPSPVALDLGHGVTTDPISLQIILDNIPKLKLTGGVMIPIPNQVDPLHFSLGMEIDGLGATATGALSGWWKNPFGISPKLQIGPKLGLSLSILWATFLEQGPSGFGLAGGFKFGKIYAEVAFEVNELPSRQFLEIHAGNFDLQDLVSLTSDIIQQDLPQPVNVVSFEEVFIYVCPVGNVDRPQGFSFKCKMTFLERKIDIYAVIQRTGAVIKGRMDNFSIGPLQVRGATEGAKQPFFGLEIIPGKQSGEIDGEITLFDLSCKLQGMFQLTPSFKFQFAFDVTFANVFDFSVQATPDKPTQSVGPTIDLEYSLSAELHQAGFDYIAGELDKLIGEFVTNLKRDQQKALGELKEAATAEWDVVINDAERNVEAFKRSWDEKSKEVRDSFDEVKRMVDRDIANLQTNLDDLNETFQESLSRAESGLVKANEARGQALRKGQDNLSDEQDVWNRKIRDAEDTLDSAKREMHRMFGNAQRDIDNATNTVRSLQNQINSISDRIEVCDDAPWWDGLKKAELGGLYATRAGLYLSKDGAVEILNAAKAVLKSADYISCEHGIENAKNLLSSARNSGDSAFEQAKGGIRYIDEQTKEFVDEARDTVNQVKKEGEKTIKTAKNALDEGKKFGQKRIGDAQSLVDGLNSCAEWLAYQGALKSLESARQHGKAAIGSIEALMTVTGGAAELLKNLGHWLSQGTTVVNITEIRLGGKLSLVCNGAPFAASVKGRLADNDFALDAELDPREPAEFIRSIYLRLLTIIEKELIPSVGQLITQ